MWGRGKMNEEKLHRHTLAPMCPADEWPCCVGRVMHAREGGWGWGGLGVRRGSWAALLINHVGTHRRHVLMLMIKCRATCSPWVDPAGFIPTSVSADESKKNTCTHTHTGWQAGTLREAVNNREWVKGEADRDTQWPGETGIRDETKKYSKWILHYGSTSKAVLTFCHHENVSTSIISCCIFISIWYTILVNNAYILWH